MHRNTVFIIDDDPSVRDALTLLLSLQGHACAAFASAEDFLAALKPGWQGCLILDIRMPGMSGLQLQSLLNEQGVQLKTILITAHGDVSAARQAFRAGAVDFLEKPFDTEQLLRSVGDALQDIGTADAAAVAADRGAVDGDAPLAGDRPRPSPALSPREREVMDLLLQGLDNRRIAAQLGISHRTVEIHKARVLEKTGVRSVVELMRRGAVRAQAGAEDEAVRG
jgi:FixJ family two-component response regulator